MRSYKRLVYLALVALVLVGIVATGAAEAKAKPYDQRLYDACMKQMTDPSQVGGGEASYFWGKEIYNPWKWGDVQRHCKACAADLYCPGVFVSDY